MVQPQTAARPTKKGAAKRARTEQEPYIDARQHVRNIAVLLSFKEMQNYIAQHDLYKPDGDKRFTPDEADEINKALDEKSEELREATEKAGGLAAKLAGAKGNGHDKDAPPVTAEEIEEAEALVAGEGLNGMDLFARVRDGLLEVKDLTGFETLVNEFHLSDLIDSGRDARLKRNDAAKLKRMLTATCEQLPPAGEAQDGEAGDEPAVIVDAARLSRERENKGDIAAAYSADKINEGKIREPFEYEGQRYVNTGGLWSADGYAKAFAWRVVPADEYSGETRSHKEKDGAGYEGIRVEHKGAGYVLTGPELIFKPAPAASPQSADADTGEQTTTPVDGYEPAAEYSVSRKFEQPLRVRLTPEEIEQKCDELDGALAELEDLNRRFEAVKKTFGSDIKNAETKVADIQKVLRRKGEEREVEVEERMCYAAKVVQEVRLDTGEVTKQRPMRVEETQTKLLL